MYMIVKSGFAEPVWAPTAPASNMLSYGPAEPPIEDGIALVVGWTPPWVGA